MPTFKEKVAEFLRQLSSGNDPSKCDLKSPCTSPTTGSFIHRYLSGEEKRNQPDILFGKSCYDLPVREIAPLSQKIVSAYTGPAGGLTKVNKIQTALSFSDPDVDFIDEDAVLAVDTQDDPNRNADDINKNELSSNNKDPNIVLEPEFPEGNHEIAGVNNWNQPRKYAFGIATTLYECHPFTRQNAGEPIADAFGVCVRGNSALMALADGVNWGDKSCLAARCAVHGCMDYLNKALYREGGQMDTTLDVFVCLLRSFHAAHNLILQENGLLTTLCAAVIVQLRDSPQFIVCTCNVGDSLAYVFSQRYGVREITQGSHDIYSMRDMRDALGALGPVDGQNPELNNLTVAMTVVDEGDIVFLTSDGISDNFDPVVGKFAMAKKPSKTTVKMHSSGADSSGATSNGASHHHHHQTNVSSGGDNKNDNKPDLGGRNAPTGNSSNLPINPFMPMVEAHQRHELTLLRMEDLLRNGVNEGDGACEDAQALCEQMIDFATKLTVAKRRILEDPDLYHVEGGGSSSAANHGAGNGGPVVLETQAPVLQVTEQRMRRRKVGEKLAMVPGKLDHASAVAYQVTSFSENRDKMAVVGSGDARTAEDASNKGISRQNSKDAAAANIRPNNSRRGSKNAEIVAVEPATGNQPASGSSQVDSGPPNVQQTNSSSRHINKSREASPRLKKKQTGRHSAGSHSSGKNGDGITGGNFESSI